MFLTMRDVVVVTPGQLCALKRELYHMCWRQIVPLKVSSSETLTCQGLYHRFSPEPNNSFTSPADLTLNSNSKAHRNAVEVLHEVGDEVLDELDVLRWALENAASFRSRSMISAGDPQIREIRDATMISARCPDRRPEITRGLVTRSLRLSVLGRRFAEKVCVCGSVRSRTVRLDSSDAFPQKCLEVGELPR